MLNRNLRHALAQRALFLVYQVLDNMTPGVSLEFHCGADKRPLHSTHSNVYVNLFYYKINIFASLFCLVNVRTE